MRRRSAGHGGGKMLWGRSGQCDAPFLDKCRTNAQLSSPESMRGCADTDADRPPPQLIVFYDDNIIVLTGEESCALVLPLSKEGAQHHSVRLTVPTAPLRKTSPQDKDQPTFSSPRWPASEQASLATPSIMHPSPVKT